MVSFTKALIDTLFVVFELFFFKNLYKLTNMNINKQF